jgi:superfamily II DNA or RNA helicase
MSKYTITFDFDPGRRQGVLSGDHFTEIREHFSVYNDAVKYARFRNRFAPSRKYVITPQGRFDPGLYYIIRKYVRQNTEDTKIHVTDAMRSIIYPTYSDVNSNLDPPLTLKLREYQQDIIDICLKIGRGVTVLATAGGKTLTIASLIESIYRTNRNMKCLILVPDLGLVNQTTLDFKEYGTTFLHSKWTGNHRLNLGSNVIIANMGILQSSKSDTEWIQDIDMLIIDEVHKLRRDNKINSIIKKIRTPHKYGLTGTMPEKLIDQWNIIGKIGPILYEKNSFQLREQNFIAKAKVQVLKIQYNDKPKVYPNDRYDPTARYRREQEFLSKNTFRNTVISKLSAKFDNNCLIMVDYIAHGEELYGILTETCKNKQVFFIRGEVAIEEREKVKKLMEKTKDVICIAISKIFSTGINIKNLHYIVFAGGGKAKVKIIQSIGRGLRLHKDKKGVIIIDIADMLYYGNQHYNKRLKLYKGEKIKYGIKSIQEAGFETGGSKAET